MVVLFLSTDVVSGCRLYKQMMNLFLRGTSDDFVVALMLFFDRFSLGHDVAWVQHSIDTTLERDPRQNAAEFYAIISQCGGCVARCLGYNNQEMITRK